MNVSNTCLLGDLLKHTESQVPSQADSVGWERVMLRSYSFNKTTRNPYDWIDLAGVAHCFSNYRRYLNQLEGWLRRMLTLCGPENLHFQHTPR